MTIISRLYYDPARPSVFSTLRKLGASTATERERKPKSYDAIRALLKKQDASTLHGRVRRRFARNPYTETNVIDVWECDLLDVEAYAKYNDNYRYILSVKDVFSKFLHMIPIKTKKLFPSPRRFGPYLRTRKDCAAQYMCELIRARNF